MKFLRAPLSSIAPHKQALAAGFAIASGYYFLQYARDPMAPHFIDAVNLVIHEAGHAILGPFGLFLHVAGGSILQIAVPIAFVVYFWRRKERYSAGLVLYWVGQNLINISVYARDAVMMQLPLLGGDPAGHDWHNLLDMLHVLPHTAIIAKSIEVSGWVVLVVAFGVSLWYSLGTTLFKK